MLFLVIYDFTAGSRTPCFTADAGEPGAQSRGSGSTKQGQHHAFGPEGRLVPDPSAPDAAMASGQVTVRHRIGRTAGPVELREGVQLNGTAEDITVERPGLTSSKAGLAAQGKRIGARYGAFPGVIAGPSELVCGLVRAGLSQGLVDGRGEGSRTAC
jgi:hypothetical protein